VGTAGLNALALAFFDPAKMLGVNCAFVDVANSPCLGPAVNSGIKDLGFVRVSPPPASGDALPRISKPRLTSRLFPPPLLFCRTPSKARWRS
jgi:hypothetical protein